MKALVCRECGKEYPTKAIHVCEMCFGPLEVKYNYEEIKKNVSRKKIQDGPHSIWRYVDLLPVEGPAFLGPHAGMTPLVRAKNLGAHLGLDELYIKNDTVNHPTLSFKDRVVAVAMTSARELGFETIACASTGNLANSVAAHAAAAGMRCYVFIPGDLEAAKVLGNLIYKPQRGRDRRQLRRCESTLQRNRRRAWLGVRQYQYPALLCGRLEDAGIRNRRTTRLAHTGPSRHPDGLRLALD